MDKIAFFDALSTISIESCESLLSMWNEIGYVDLEEKCNMLIGRVKKILDNLVAEERDYKIQIEKEIEFQIVKHDELIATLQCVDLEKEGLYSQSLTRNLNGLSLLEKKQLMSNKLSQANKLRNLRLSMINDLHSQLIRIYQKLNTPTESRPSFGKDSNVKLDDLSLRIIERYCHELHIRKQESRQKDLETVKLLRTNIRILARELDQPESVALTQSIVPTDDLELQYFVKQLESELERLQNEKHQRFAQDIKETLSALKSEWTDYTRITGEAIDPMLDTMLPSLVVSEQTVQKLKDILADIKERNIQAKDVIKHIERREEILSEYKQMIESQQAKDRLLNKRKGMAAQLLKEEKIRSAYRVQLPRIDAKLLSFATEWEEKHNGESFSYKGKALRDTLASLYNNDNDDVSSTATYGGSSNSSTSSSQRNINITANFSRSASVNCIKTMPTTRLAPPLTPQKRPLPQTPNTYQPTPKKAKIATAPTYQPTPKKAKAVPTVPETIKKPQHNIPVSFRVPNTIRR